MLTLETFETSSSIAVSLNCIFVPIFSLKLYRGMCLVEFYTNCLKATTTAAAALSSTNESYYYCHYFCPFLNCTKRVRSIHYLPTLKQLCSNATHRASQQFCFCVFTTLQSSNYNNILYIFSYSQLSKHEASVFHTSHF